MGFYDDKVLPRFIDKMCGDHNLGEVRADVLAHARGHVLEVGFGSGHNLKHLGAAAERVTALDPAVELTDLAEGRIARSALPVDVVNASAEAIPYDDDTFDTVVTTWTLCSIPNVYRALQELRRVVKPGGLLIFAEHGASPDPGVLRLQRGIEPVWKTFTGGCHLARKPDELIADAGFSLADLRADYLPGPRFASFVYRGVALPR